MRADQATKRERQPVGQGDQPKSLNPLARISSENPVRAAPVKSGQSGALKMFINSMNARAKASQTATHER